VSDCRGGGRRGHGGLRGRPVLGEAALGDLGNVSQEWDPATETLTINRLTVERDGQVIDLLAKEKFQVLRRERSLEQATLDGRLTATLQIPDLRVGDIVDYAYTTIYAPKLLTGRHAESSGFFTEPVGAFRIRALWDDASPVRWRAGSALPAPTVSRTASGTEFLIEARDALAPAPPSFSPARYYDAGMAQFSQFNDWKQVSALLWPLFDKASTLAPNSPLKAEAARIKAAASTPEAQATLALKLVEEQVRYLAITMEAQGYTPAMADDTWRRRYGDCKGKTALLIALLRELGIEAQPALVATEQGDLLAATLPQVSAFDHVIVRATIGGRVYWLDGTRVGDGPIGKIDTPDFAWALPLAAGGADLQAMVVEPPDRPILQTIVRIDASGGFKTAQKVEASLLLRGDAGLVVARNLGGRPRATAEAMLIEEYAKRWDWAQFKSAAWRWDEAEALMTVTFNGEGQLPVETVQGEPHLDLPDTDRNLIPIKLRPAGEDAAAPYLVKYPTYARFVTIVTLPKDIQGLELFGDPVDSEIGGYAETRRVEQVGPYAVASSSVRALKPEMTAEEATEAVKRFETAYKTLDDYQVAHAGIRVAAPKARPPRLASLDAQTAWSMGRWLAEQEDWRRALEAYDVAAKKGVTDPQLTLDRAWTLYGLGRQSDALNMLRLDDPRFAELRYEVLFLRSRLLADQGQPTQALTELDQEIGRTPTGWGYALRAETNRRLGRREAAMADVAAAEATGDPRLDRWLVTEMLDAGRWEQAATIARRAVKADPQVPERWIALSRAEAGRERHARALEAADEALRIWPFDEDAMTERTTALAHLNRKTEADAQADAILALNPDDPGTLNSVCYLRATQRLDLRKGLAECERASAASPKDAAIIDSRGFAKLQLERHAEAMADFEAALSMNPKQVESLYGRGIARLRLGQTAAGQADLASAETMRPGIGALWRSYGIAP
jgi:tetratricopeptide (TPR) repeat protein/transglutaminase-like putative cysteine protease